MDPCPWLYALHKELTETEGEAASPGQQTEQLRAQPAVPGAEPSLLQGLIGLFSPCFDLTFNTGVLQLDFSVPTHSLKVKATTTSFLLALKRL